MADSFADLWNASAPSTSTPASSSIVPLSQQRPSQQPAHKKYDAFAILAGSGSNTPRSNTPGASRPTPPPVQAPQRSGDAFNDLLSFGSNNPTSPNRHLSLADRQAKAQQQPKIPTVQVSNKASDAFWDQFGSESPVQQASTSKEDDWNLNLLSAKPAPTSGTTVRSSSASPSPTPLRQPAPSIPADPFDFDSLVSSTTPEPSHSRTASTQLDDGLLDDTFGGGGGANNGTSSHLSGNEDGDDILGLLAKPISQSHRAPSPLSVPAQSTRRTPSPQPPTRKPVSRAPSPPPHIIGQIVEMGYSPSQARVALAATETGLDVQGALEILLAQAGSSEPPPLQERAARYGDDGGDSSEEERRRRRARRQGPTRSKVEPSTLPPSRSQTASQSQSTAGNLADLLPPDISVHADKLLSQATELGKGMFNSANAFWRVGKEKAKKAYEERARTPSDQPVREGDRNGNGAAGAGGRKPAWMSEEAGFKDDSSSDDERSRPESIQSTPSVGVSRQGSANPSSSSSRPPTQARESPPNRSPAPPSAPSVYKSSLRRGATPRQTHSIPAQVTPPSRPTQPILPPSSLSSSKPSRSPVSATPAQISLSTRHLSAASSHNTQGAYSAATEAYTKALAALPEKHVLTVDGLIGRAKARGGCGESRGVVEDCSSVLVLITEGISTSEWSTIPPPSAPGASKRKLGYVESEVRKLRAMAYEQMEKWNLAKDDWEKIAGMNVPREVDEATRKEAITGAGRCRKILAPPPPPSSSAQMRPKPKPAPKPASLASKPSLFSKPSEAVARLRAVNEQAESESNLASSLKDSVDARLTAWRGGKQANLRALLASLENILWEEIGWKKIGMHELVTEGQVKKAYVRAIAKVHPDKLNVNNSTVEQRMIANDVFGTLNEAWIAFQG